MTTRIRVSASSSSSAIRMTIRAISALSPRIDARRLWLWPHAIPDAIIIPTGTFGKSFNQTDRPHFRILADHLTEHGIDGGRIVPALSSARTLEDALAVRTIAVRHAVRDITIVTSTYHMPRVRFLFARILFDYELTFVAATSISPEPERGGAGTRKNGVGNVATGWTRP